MDSDEEFEGFDSSENLFAGQKLVEGAHCSTAGADAFNADSSGFLRSCVYRTICEDDTDFEELNGCENGVSEVATGRTGIHETNIGGASVSAVVTDGTNTRELGSSLIGISEIETSGTPVSHVGAGGSSVIVTGRTGTSEINTGTINVIQFRNDGTSIDELCISEIGIDVIDIRGTGISQIGSGGTKVSEIGTDNGTGVSEIDTGGVTGKPGNHKKGNPSVHPLPKSVSGPKRKLETSYRATDTFESEPPMWLSFHGDESEIEDLSGSDDEDEVDGFLTRNKGSTNETSQMDTGEISKNDNSMDTTSNDLDTGVNIIDSCDTLRETATSETSETVSNGVGTYSAENEDHSSRSAEPKRRQKRKAGAQSTTKRKTGKRAKVEADTPKWLTTQITTDVPIPPVSFSPPPSKTPTPYGYFKLFMDTGIINSIVEQTNIYSAQKSEERQSIDISTSDMEQFLGILLLMGIHKVPSYRAHWASASRYHPIADVMPRNRFDQIKNFLHFNDNNRMKKRGELGYDKLFKVRPLIDALKLNFLKIEPHVCQSIDEIMIPSKASSPLRQFNKNKPHRFGIKVEGRAGADGFLHDFSIYAGKSDAEPTGPWGVSGDVVVKLTESLQADAQFFIFADNWFSSYALAKYIGERGWHYTGTIRQNRIPSNDLKTDAELKRAGRGTFDARISEDGVRVVKWQDNKAIHLISTYCGTEPLDEVKRWSVSQKRFTIVERPDIVRQYNQYMGGIDLNDYLVALYRTSVGTKRYYMRIFFHLLDVCVVNAWLLYRRHMTQKNLKPLNLLEFRLEIAGTLISYGKHVLKHRGKPSAKKSKASKAPVTVSSIAPSLETRYDSIDHWPVEDRRNRWHWCDKRTVFTFFKCGKCNVPLCLRKGRNCFHEFHKIQC